VESGVEKTDKAASPMRRRQYGRRRDLEQQPHDTSATTGPARPPYRRRARPCGRCRLVAQRSAAVASANFVALDPGGADVRGGRDACSRTLPWSVARSRWPPVRASWSARRRRVGVLSAQIVVHIGRTWAYPAMLDGAGIYRRHRRSAEHPGKSSRVDGARTRDPCSGEPDGTL